MWTADKSRSALNSRSRLALRPLPVARILVRFIPRRSARSGPTSPSSTEIPTEQLFLEMRIGETQSLSNLAPQEVGLLAYERDETIIINLLHATEGDVRISGNSLTMWQIPISSLEPLEKKEVLLRGGQHGMQFPVHATLMRVPLQPSSHVRRKRLLLWDSHGFVVHQAFEAQYLAWERHAAKQLQQPSGTKASWEDRRLSRPRDADGFPLRCELEDVTLLRRGMPDLLRSQAWKELSGADLVAAARAEDYYEELVRQAHLEGTDWHRDIVQDIPRTFPDHPFLCDIRGRQMLERVLLAYSLHNPKVGYCQAMNFLCAFLLLYMDEQSAFWCLSRIIEDRMAGYYIRGMVQVQVDQMLLSLVIEEQLPELHNHLAALEVALCTITMRWFMCLFIGIVPPETTARIWDCFLQDGRDVIFRCTVALLRMHSQEILACHSFEEVFEKLKQLPVGTFDADALMLLAYEDDSVLLRLMELRAQKEDLFYEQVSSKPHAIPLSMPGGEGTMDLADILELAPSEHNSSSSHESSEQDHSSSSSSDSSGEGVLASVGSSAIDGCTSLLDNAGRAMDQLGERLAGGRSHSDKGWLSSSEYSALKQFVFPHELEEYEQKYCSLLEPGQSCLDLQGFQSALGGASSFVDSCFEQFDSDGDGYLSMCEYIKAMHLLSRADPQQQAELLFESLQRNGTVSGPDLQHTVQRHYESACRQAGGVAEEALLGVAQLVEDSFERASGAQELNREEFCQLCTSGHPTLWAAVHQSSVGASHQREARLKLMNDDLYAAQQEMLGCPRSMRTSLKHRIDELDRICRDFHDFHRSL